MISPVLIAELVLREQRARGMPRGRLEHGDDRRLLGARTQRRAPLPAFARGQPQRFEQDRFARAGFAGEHVQAGGEIQLGLFDQDDVADGQRGQHGPPLRRRSGTPC